MSRHFAHFVTAVPLALFVNVSVCASDWGTGGGGAARNGSSTEVGPSASIDLWSLTNLSSLGVPVRIEGQRVFHVSRTQVSPVASTLRCVSLDGGVPSWTRIAPHSAYGMTAFSMGVDHGRLYTTTLVGKITAIDVTNGIELWDSAETFPSTTYVGAHLLWGTDMVFAPDGDPIVDAYEGVFRLSAVDGSTLWSAARPNGGTGGRGVARSGNVLYAAQTTVAGCSVLAIDLVTGAVLAESPVIADAVIDGRPFLDANDGVLIAVTSPTSFPQLPPTVNALVSLRFLGASFSQQWVSAVPSSAEMLAHAVAPDGSIVRTLRTPSGLVAQRVDGTSGGVLTTSGVLATQFIFSSPIVIDAQSRAYLTYSTPGPGGQLLALDSNLGVLWAQSFASFADEGPALGSDGTLVVSGAGSLKALRTPRTPTDSYCAGDGSAQACPCAPGYAGNGCPDSAFPGGARLSSDGVASVSGDTFVLKAMAMPNGPALFVQGSNRLASGMGFVFGDGLRCAGGSVVRLGVKTNAHGDSNYPDAGDVPISVRGLVPSTGGTLLHYQVWFRDAAPFCTTSSFNLSNGLSVSWVP